MIGLIYTLLTGLFFLIGICLNKILKNKKNINVLAVSLSFVVLVNLICFDIIPEISENFNFKSFLVVVLGLAVLKIFDLFVPHHHHNHKDKHDNVKEHNEHLEHISIVSILSLTLHNIIECMALYTIANANNQAGLLMACGIALHNIPLGFQIGGSLNNNSKTYTVILTLSGFVGGVICMFLGTLSHAVETYILCFTLGMLIYLTIFELLKEIYSTRKNIYVYYGIIIGITIVMISGLL